MYSWGSSHIYVIPLSPSPPSCLGGQPSVSNTGNHTTEGTIIPPSLPSLCQMSLFFGSTPLYFPLEGTNPGPFRRNCLVLRSGSLLFSRILNYRFSFPSTFSVDASIFFFHFVHSVVIFFFFGRGQRQLLELGNPVHLL